MFVRVGFKFIKKQGRDMSQNCRKKNVSKICDTITLKKRLLYLWDVLGVDAVNGVAHVLPGGDQQGEPQQADHWAQEHVRNA